MNRSLPQHPDPSSLPPGLTSSSTTPHAAARWADARLRRHADYQIVYAAARKQFSSSMAWFAALRPAPPTGSASARVGLTVGKVLGKAHDRNRIKRRLRAAIREHRALLPDGLDLILHPRRDVLTANFSQISDEIAAIFTAASAAATHHPERLLKKPSAAPERPRQPRRSPSAPAPAAAQSRRGALR